MSSQLLVFVGIATLVTITPGADTMLVVRNVLMRGRGAGLFTTAGIYAGLSCHALLAILGLSAILVRSAALYEGVKLLGAGYLGYLGCRSLWQAFRHPTNGSGEVGGPRPIDVARTTCRRDARWRSIGEGFLSNILNPKVAAFYLAFLPQFVNPGELVRAELLLLAGIHFAIGIVWLTLLTIFVGWLRAWLARPAIQRGLEAVTGAVLITFGVRLALERR